MQESGPRGPELRTPVIADFTLILKLALPVCMCKFYTNIMYANLCTSPECVLNLDRCLCGFSAIPKIVHNL